MNINKHLFLLLLLLCYTFSTLLAQQPIITQSGSGNTQTNNINTNKKELDRIEKLLRQSIAKQDTLLLALKKNEEERARIDSLHNKDIAQKDSIFYQALNKLTKKRERLLYESDMGKSTIESQKQQIEELKRIIQIQKNTKYTALPFGIHQFATKQTGKGIIFVGTQIGLLGTSIGYGISANNNFSKHKNNKYEKWERDRFYEKYENHLNNSGWFLAGAVVMIGLNYCDNFNWFRKNNIGLAAIPTFDWQGKPQMAMIFNVKF